MVKCEGCSVLGCGSNWEYGSFLYGSVWGPAWQQLEETMKTVIKLPFGMGVPF